MLSMKDAAQVQLLTYMKATLPAVMVVIFLSSCVFEEPFEPSARIPVDPLLAGLWLEEVADAKRAPNRLLVLKQTENEYLVQYPAAEGEHTMFFRAFPIDLDGSSYIQIQLTGTGKGPVKEADRKYHLLKTRLDGRTLDVHTIDPDMLGAGLKDSQSLREAFAKKKDDPALFSAPFRFRKAE
jgi:hypothetical protein